jgi:hypothetical protein
MARSVPPVRRPARMIRFSSVSAFRRHASNFYLMFLAPEEPIPDIFRHRPAFWRFANQYPRRLAELEALLEAEDRRPSDRSWPLLLEAYNLMGKLVDMMTRASNHHPTYPILKSTPVPASTVSILLARLRPQPTIAPACSSRAGAYI